MKYQVTARYTSVTEHKIIVDALYPLWDTLEADVQVAAIQKNEHISADYVAKSTPIQKWTTNGLVIKENLDVIDVVSVEPHSYVDNF